MRTSGLTAEWVRFSSEWLTAHHSILQSVGLTRRLIVPLRSKLGNKSCLSHCWDIFSALVNIFRSFFSVAWLYALSVHNKARRGLWKSDVPVKWLQLFKRSTIFSSKSPVAWNAQTDCLLWISVCYLIKAETRCSGAQLCSDVMFIITPQPCRIIILPIESGHHPAGLPEGSRMFAFCLVLKSKARTHMANLTCSFSASHKNCNLVKRVRVWVRNVVKIAAVLSASTHEKECCCFSKAWVNVHNV